MTIDKDPELGNFYRDKIWSKTKDNIDNVCTINIPEDNVSQIHLHIDMLIM